MSITLHGPSLGLGLGISCRAGAALGSPKSNSRLQLSKLVTRHVVVVAWHSRFAPDSMRSPSGRGVERGCKPPQFLLLVQHVSKPRTLRVGNLQQRLVVTFKTKAEYAHIVLMSTKCCPIQPHAQLPFLDSISIVHLQVSLFKKSSSKLPLMRRSGKKREPARFRRDCKTPYVVFFTL